MVRDGDWSPATSVLGAVLLGGCVEVTRTVSVAFDGVDLAWACSEVSDGWGVLAEVRRVLAPCRLNVGGRTS